MRGMFLIAIALVAACSSSSSGGGGSAAPSCKNPSSSGAGSASCTSCVQSSCGSQLAGVETNCQAYITCYEGCDCSDLACLNTCLQTKVDATCQSSFSSEGMCLQQSCASQCTAAPADAGGGG